MAEATHRVEALTCDLPLLAAGAAIDDLVKRSGVAVQAARDIPRREAELAQADRRIAELLRRLGSRLPPARAAEALPQAAVVAEARRLFHEHEKLRADLDRLPGGRNAARQHMAAIEAYCAASLATNQDRYRAALAGIENLGKLVAIS